MEGLEVEGQGALKKVTGVQARALTPSPCLAPNSAFSWFTVTTEIDSFIGIDYSLMEAPRETAQMLDVMLKVRVLEQGLGGSCLSVAFVPQDQLFPGASGPPGFRSIFISPWFQLC